MTKRKSVKWEEGRFETKTKINEIDERNMADYLRAGLKVRMRREELIDHLGSAFGRSDRQIERHLAAAMKHQKPVVPEIKRITGTIIGNPGRGRYFDIPIEGNVISINDITVRTSDPFVPFKFMIFERATSDDFPADIDSFWAEKSSGRRLTLIKPSPQRYEDQDGCGNLHCGISVYQHAVRFDLNEKELEEYLKKPVSFEVTLDYKSA